MNTFVSPENIIIPKIKSPNFIETDSQIKIPHISTNKISLETNQQSISTINIPKILDSVLEQKVVTIFKPNSASITETKSLVILKLESTDLDPGIYLKIKNCLSEFSEELRLEVLNNLKIKDAIFWNDIKGLIKDLKELNDIILDIYLEISKMSNKDHLEEIKLYVLELIHTLNININKTSEELDAYINNIYDILESIKSNFNKYILEENRFLGVRFNSYEDFLDFWLTNPNLLYVSKIISINAKTYLIYRLPNRGESITKDLNRYLKELVVGNQDLSKNIPFFSVNTSGELELEISDYPFGFKLENGILYATI